MDKPFDAGPCMKHGAMCCEECSEEVRDILVIIDRWEPVERFVDEDE